LHKEEGGEGRLNFPRGERNASASLIPRAKWKE